MMQVVIMPGSLADQACVFREENGQYSANSCVRGGAKCQGGRGGVSKYGPSPARPKGRASA